MDLLKLLVIFCLIIMILKFKKPLYVAILAGIAGACIAYGIDGIQAIKIMGGCEC